jgi:hypothetical protein
MNGKSRILIVLLGFLMFAVLVQPGEPQNRGAFSFYIENDCFAMTDRYYTNGVKLTWVSPDRLTLKHDPAAQRAISVSFGQNIYTPANIEIVDLIQDDRPYAGISYLAVAFHQKKGRRMDTLEFNVGIVGPHSYAEQSQKFIHGLIKGKEPKGWQNQLKDELALGIIYDRKWRIKRFWEHDHLGSDLIGHLGGSLGNVVTAANTGWEIRVGWNLPKDFGTFIIRPGGESSTFFDAQASQRSGQWSFGAHAFLYLGGHAVLRNIFLDGNTFQKSHSVEKSPFVADIVAGFALTYKQFKVSYAYVFRTKQFKTQEKNQVFGAVNISFAY